MLTIKIAFLITKILFLFVFLYPIIMSLFWIIGTITYYRNYQRYQHAEKPKDQRMFTVVMPVHNEEDILSETIMKNLSLDYENVEFYIIDDCSTDRTYEIAKEWERKNNKIKVFKTKTNKGKANALNEAMKYVTTEYFLCLDGDAYLEKNALNYFNYLLESYGDDIKRIAAITGQPKLIDGDVSFIHQLQRVEYRSIISMIKKSQGLFDHIFSVSGVCTLYKKDVVESLGGFNPRNQTEDIEITWRIQRNGYLVKYEPMIMVYMYTPNTFKQLLRQRIRWAIGGLQTVNQNVHSRTDKPLGIEMKSFALEFFISTIWAFSFFISTFLLIYILIFGNLGINDYLEALSPVIILALYSFVLMYVGYKYEIGEKEDFKIFLKSSFMIAVVYWTINPISLVAALFKYYILGKRGGTWNQSRS